MEIVKERTCPNCTNQINVLRVERKVEQYFEIRQGEDWNDYQPAECNEQEWEAICYETTEGEGCMVKMPFYAEDYSDRFMDGEVDGHGFDLMDVKAVEV